MAHDFDCMITMTIFYRNMFPTETKQNLVILVDLVILASVTEQNVDCWEWTLDGAEYTPE